MRDKFSFLHANIRFNVTKCFFSFCQKQQFTMLVVFLSTFFNDISLIFFHNSVALSKQVIMVIRTPYKIMLECKQHNFLFDIENLKIPKMAFKSNVMLI